MSQLGEWSVVWGCRIGSGRRRLPRRNSGKWRRFGKWVCGRNELKKGGATRINLGGYCADCRSIKFKLPDELKPGQLIEIDCRLQSARIATTQRGSQFWRIHLRVACAKICLHAGNFENYRLRTPAAPHKQGGHCAHDILWIRVANDCAPARSQTPRCAKSKNTG